MRTRGLAFVVGLVLAVTVDVAAGQTLSVPLEPSSPELARLPASVAPVVPDVVSGRRYLEGAAVPSDDNERPCRITN